MLAYKEYGIKETPLPVSISILNCLLSPLTIYITNFNHIRFVKYFNVVVRPIQRITIFFTKLLHNLLPLHSSALEDPTCDSPGISIPCSGT